MEICQYSVKSRIKVQCLPVYWQHASYWQRRYVVHYTEEQLYKEDVDNLRILRTLHV